MFADQQLKKWMNQYGFKNSQIFILQKIKYIYICFLRPPSLWSTYTLQGESVSYGHNHVFLQAPFNTTSNPILGHIFTGMVYWVGAILIFSRRSVWKYGGQHCTVPESMNRRRIRLIENNDANSVRLKNDLERDFAAAVYLFEAPSPPRFLSWGCLAILWVLNLVTYRV